MLILASRFSLSASVFALGAAFGSPAFAQTESQQQQAQQQNTAVDCSTITDASARQQCLATQAQNAPATAAAPPEGAIVVTGSRIPKPNFDTVQPSTVLSSQAIEQRGFVNAADALNELPQFGIPGSSPVGAGQGGAFGTGQSFVNFLGLGSQRTLVLVNGRRFISSNTASIFGPTSPGEQVDLGLVNTKLIDRIETIAIGGAPIYGSDAIAGTVNIVLKKDYEGIDVDGENGISSRGDADNWRIRALAGHNFLDGRANLTASAEYSKGDGLLYTDRKVLSRGLFYDNCDPATSTFNQCIYTDGPRVVATLPGGVPLVGSAFGLDFGMSPTQASNIFGAPFSTGVPGLNGDPNAADVFFDNAGNLVPFDYGLNPGGPNNFDLFSAGGNGFAYIRDTSQALSNTERYNANLIGHFDITDNVRLFMEGWYSHSKSANLATQPEYNSGIFDSAGNPAGSLILSVNNPFLTAAQSAQIVDAINNNFLSDQNCPFGPFAGPCPAVQDYFYLSRANIDIPTGFSTFTDNVYRGVVGLDGKFDMLAGKWNWEVVGNYGRSYAVGRTVDINTQNFFNAVGQVTVDNPTGVPCLAGLANSPYPTFSSTCSPFNPFGVGRSSQASLDYILSPIKNKSDNKQFVFTADLTGPLFKLPGGDLSVALGVEHRAESTNNYPSPFYYGGNPSSPISYGQTVPIVPIKGKFHTNEVFGEVDADIVSPSNNVPFLYSFDVQAAARYVDHSVAGGDVTWTLGSRLAPVRDLAFRGNFTHAIRAPSIQEAFIPSSTFFSFATDPCDVDNLGSGPDPSTRQANCLAEGIPPTFQSNASSASFLQSTGGNSNLKNERSNAYSIGAVLTPRFIPRLNLSVDYVNVLLKDAISAFSGTQVLDACYDAPNPGSNSFCGLFTRNPVSHQLTFIETSFYNAAQLQYRGIVAAWSWKVNTPFLGASSTLDFGGSYQHLLELTTKADSASAKSHSEGTLGYPKDSLSTTLNYVNGPVSLFTNLNYSGPVDQGVDEPAGFREHQRLHSFVYVNGGGTITVAKRFRFFFDVDNIFDVKPPFPVPANGGAITYFPGVIGRYFRFGAGVHF